MAERVSISTLRTGLKMPECANQIFRPETVFLVAYFLFLHYIIFKKTIKKSFCSMTMYVI